MSNTGWQEYKGSERFHVFGLRYNNLKPFLLPKKESVTYMRSYCDKGRYQEGNTREEIVGIWTDAVKKRQHQETEK